MSRSKLLAVILCIALLFNVVPIMQAFADAVPKTVYLDMSSGSDSNDGSTQSSAFKTFDAAISAIESSDKDSGVIFIVGTAAVPRVPNKNRALMPTNTKPIVIKGVNGSSVFTVAETASVTQLVISGPITFEDITIGAKFAIRCEWNQVTFGENVTMSSDSNPNNWHSLITGAYGTYNGNQNPPRESVTIDSGKFHTVWIGNSCNYKARESYGTNITYGVDYVQNGGSFARINLGTDASNTDYCLGNRYRGGINITINGGTIGTNEGYGGIVLQDAQLVIDNSKPTNFNTHPVQIILNNNTESNILSGNIVSKSDIESHNGVYYLLSCTSGGTLSTTSTAGTYSVSGANYAIATDRADSSNVYTSVDGVLTVPSGSYDVTFTDALASWDVTAENVSGTSMAYTESDNTFNFTVPAGKLAAAYDSENGKVYVAGDKSVADKAPTTSYVNTKYTDWGCFDNNGSYLTNTYKKLTEDKELTVVYFGGSLTNGYGCGETGDPNGSKPTIHRNTHSWRALSGNWLDTNFPEATITKVDAAIGESGTFLGTYRVQADIIAQNPDLLFIEYAINDTYYGSTESVAALQLETIVREVKQARPDCDIVIVLTTDKTYMSTSYNGDLFPAASGHKTIADAYGLPVVNLGLGLAKGIAEAESNTTWWNSDSIWNQYFIDRVHPFSTGHEYYYLCMKEFLENNLLYTTHTNVTRNNLPAVQSDYLLDGGRLSIYGTDMQDYYVSGTNASYNSGIFVTSTSDTPREGYYQISAGGSITFRFTGTEFTVWSNLYNNFTYSVDGGAATSVSASSHAPTRVVSGLSSRSHTITLSPSEAMQIAGIFVRDSAKQTLQGETYEYDDFRGMTLTLPSGSYHVYYASTVGELPNADVSVGKQFAGWKNESDNLLEDSVALEKNMVLTADFEDVCEVFLSASGNDSNDGTSEAPFATLDQAVNTIKASGKNGVINIIGTFTIDNSNRRMNNNPYTNMITIRGANSSSVLNISAQLNMGGPLTLESINVTVADILIIQCLRHEFCVGSDVSFTYRDSNITYAPRIVSGSYAEYPRVNSPAKESGSINGGEYNRLHLGNSATTSNYYTNSGGADFEFNNGRIYELWLGADGWASDRLGYTNYLGDVNFTMNGGTLDKIKINDAGAASKHNGHAIQLIFNNGTGVVNTDTIPTSAAVEAKGGELYIMNCASGVSLSATATAGTYNVSGDYGVVAVDKEDSSNIYFSRNGQLVLPEGNYDVESCANGYPFKSHSLVLDDAIGVNFFMDLSMLSSAQKASSYMTFSITNAAGEKRADYNSDFTDLGGRGYYGFTCPLSSVQLSDTITPTFHYGSNTIVGDTYSAKDYIDYVNNHPKVFTDEALVELVNSIGNYGYYAQQNFLGSSTLSGYRTVTDYSSEYNDKKTALASYAHSKDDYYAYTLNFSSNTYLLIRFKNTVNVTFSGVTDVTDSSADYSDECYYKYDGSNNRVDLQVTLPILKLGDKFTVNGKVNGETYEIANISAFSYMYSILNNSSNTNLKNLLCSLHDYYSKAVAYQESIS